MTHEATITLTSAAPSATAAPETAPAVRRCPWCSERLPAGSLDTCPSCHANLVAGGDARLPGLTEVEAVSAVRARRADAPRRSRLLSWISGDVDDLPEASPTGVTPDAIALPDRDVRREMLRLQLEAEGITVAADGSLALPDDADTAAGTAGSPATPAPADPAAQESGRTAG
jgi:hypothetical protein